MMYKAFTDFTPIVDYMGYTLGEFTHDDSDGFQKHDYDVYELVCIKEYDDGIVNEMYDRIKSLKISPYEKSQVTVEVKFKEAVDTLLNLNHGLEKSL